VREEGLGMEGREREREGEMGGGGKGMRGKEGVEGNGRNASGPNQVGEEIDTPDRRPTFSYTCF